MAKHISHWSKDPSTKVGAVIVDNERRVVGLGFNGFARGVHDHKERYDTREMKYEMVVHAEPNAIYNAKQNVSGFTLYCTFFPCPRCAAHIIQAGIKRVVALKNPSDDRYADMRVLSITMFEEADVNFEMV